MASSFSIDSSDDDDRDDEPTRRRSLFVHRREAASNPHLDGDTSEDSPPDFAGL